MKKRDLILVGLLTLSILFYDCRHGPVRAEGASRCKDKSPGCQEAFKQDWSVNAGIQVRMEFFKSLLLQEESSNHKSSGKGQSLLQQAWFLVLIHGSFLLLLILLGSAFLIRRKRMQQKQLEEARFFTEIKLITLLKQLEPHFIFNTLSTINAVIMQEEPRNAYTYLTKFAQLMHLSLDGANQIVRSLKEEIQFIENYLDIQQWRFSDKFDYRVAIQEHVDTGLQIPKLLIQTRVEKALNQRIRHKKGKGMLIIEARQEERHLVITVEDNGVGRTQARQYSEHASGRDIAPLTAFCELLNQYNREKLQTSVNDLKDKNGEAAGTKVVIQIPLNFKYVFHHASS